MFAYALAHLDHGFKRNQRRIGHINMRAYVLNAVRGKQLECLLSPSDYVFAGQCGLAFSPALDTLKQSAATIPARLARGHRSVQVNVRLNKRRRHQIATRV